MPSGGAGRGQGRKPGSVNSATRRIIEQAEKDNVLPLQVMFDNIRVYTKQADELIAKLLSGALPQLEEAETEDGENPHADVIEAIKQVIGLRKLAGEEAARAAQYVHPRQGYAGDDEKQDDGFVPLHERLEAYQRRDDLAAAGGNVVDLTVRKDN